MLATVDRFKRLTNVVYGRHENWAVLNTLSIQNVYTFILYTAIF